MFINLLFINVFILFLTVIKFSYYFILKHYIIITLAFMCKEHVTAVAQAFDQ